jgi:hypothetical protein
MKQSTIRSIVRCVHLIVVIPILGQVYGKPSEVEQYAGGVRYLFVPIIILSGYWMYGGVVFAVIGAAAWLAAIHFSGFGVAVLSQLVLLIARKIWLVSRARKSKRSAPVDAGSEVTAVVE